MSLLDRLRRAVTPPRVHDHVDPAKYPRLAAFLVRHGFDPDDPPMLGALMEALLEDIEGESDR